MFREIGIRAVANGFLVQVGCQQFVFERAETLLKDLGEYLADPVKKEEAMLKTAVNSRWTSGPLEANQCITERVYHGPDVPLGQLR